MERFIQHVILWVLLFLWMNAIIDCSVGHALVHILLLVVAARRWPRLTVISTVILNHHRLVEIGSTSWIQ